jgi:diguanylate cyclase (GGDEF)-like protein
MPRLSMRARLTIYSVVFVAIAVAIAILAGNGFSAIEKTVQDLGQTRLGATRVLGELSDQLVEFRLAEISRALAPDARAVVDDDLAATAHRRAIEALLTEYVGLIGGPAATNGDYAALRSTLAEYMLAHDAWVKADPGGADRGPTVDGSRHYHLYQSAAVAADRLIRGNNRVAVAKAEATYQLIQQATGTLIAGTIAATLFAVAMSIMARRQVMKPLGDITEAMDRLAAGDQDVVVPEQELRDEIGRLAKAFDVFRANAEAHAATRVAQQQAQALAEHDPLTGLPNRRMFSVALESALSRVRDEGAVCTVFIIDIDRFKQINDLHGHATGDLVLCEVADRLRKAVRAGDTVARLGGDEFAIIAPSGPEGHPGMERRLASRIVDAIAVPMVFPTEAVETGVSIGIAMVPADAADAEGALRAADTALYRAKHDGRGVFHFFDEAMGADLRAEASLEADLRTAISRGDITPYYQPLIDFRSNGIEGFEVLARWHHQERGWVPPDVFIPLAERLGLILQLTAAILRQACRDGLQWEDGIRLSVNVSSLLLKDSLLPTQVSSILRQEGFPPARLRLEITEKSLLTDLEGGRRLVTALRATGIGVWLDDFGTGYSSLYQLRELKLDKIKIDRAFVQSMQENPDSENVVDGILGLARSIGMPAIAEGIESPEVRESLINKGCEFGQGYLFGKAIPAAEVAAALLAQARLREVG